MLRCVFSSSDVCSSFIQILAAGLGYFLLVWFFFFPSLIFAFMSCTSVRLFFTFLDLIVGKRWKLLTMCYFIMYYFFLHAALWYKLLCWALLLWLQGANALLACHRSHSYQKSLALIMLFLLSLLITTICIFLDSPGLWSVVWSDSILCVSPGSLFALLSFFALLWCKRYFETTKANVCFTHLLF